MSVNLDELEGGGRSGQWHKAKDGLWRDRWDRLAVVPPDGVEAEPYTRYSTVAKAMDEGGGLVPWAQTMGILGTLRHRGIQTRWEALMAAHYSPWYAGDKVKAECRKLATESARAGGSEDARDRGSALHAIIAGINRGLSPHFTGAETLADLEAYCQTLEDYGVVVIPELVERAVVLDEYRVGGSPDGVATVEGYELPLVVDVKTGADPSYSWLPWSVQVSGYSRADALYTQGTKPNDSTREPFPEVDQDTGLIIWLPAGTGTCQLFTLDLRAGWEAFLLAMKVRGFRTRKDLHAPLSRWAPKPAPTLELVPELAPEPWPSERRAWLQARVQAIGAHPEARVALAQRWPAGVAPLHKSDAHTATELEAVASAVSVVEARYSIPFGATDPTATTPPPRHLFPTTTTTTTTTKKDHSP